MATAGVRVRAVAAARGGAWIGVGFRLFRQAPGVWIGSFVVLAVVVYGLGHLGTLGNLLSNLLVFLLIGGLMRGCEAQQAGEPLRFAHLRAGLQAPYLRPLLVLGLCALLATGLVTLTMIAGLGAMMAGALLGGGSPDALQVGPSLLVALLAALLVLLPISMALWFAAPLITRFGLPAEAALRASLRAGLRNPGAMLVNGLLMMGIAILATLPFGLGWLVAGPTLIASVYAACIDLFEAEACG